MACCSVQALGGQRLPIIVISTASSHQARSRARRKHVQTQCSLVKQLCLGAAGVAAVGVTAITVRQALIQRNNAQQGLRRVAGDSQQQQPGGAPPPPADGAWGLQLKWPLGDKTKKADRQLLQTVDDIEQRQQQEAQQQLLLWDQRMALRAKPLTELRALAQRHSIAGRSRMRKRELVAALEGALGFVPEVPDQAPQQQSQQPVEQLKREVHAQ